ncbi:MAG: hypothetical protein H9W81_07535 [Enterococcus sp.]|nr:hypothetical protein [Enterococcus sp.]
MSTKFYLTREPLGNEIDGFEPEPAHLYETALEPSDFIGKTSEYLRANTPWEFSPMNITSAPEKRYLMLVKRGTAVDDKGLEFWENLFGPLTALD